GSMLSMNPFYTSHRIGQLILKRSALGIKPPLIVQQYRNYIFAIMSSANSLHLRSLAPSIRRSKS
ncbi:hypothetical protein D6C13_23365, partial [Rahnella woolbedingensis]